MDALQYRLHDVQALGIVRAAAAQKRRRRGRRSAPAVAACAGAGIDRSPFRLDLGGEQGARCEAEGVRGDPDSALQRLGLSEIGDDCAQIGVVQMTQAFLNDQRHGCTGHAMSGRIAVAHILGQRLIRPVADAPNWISGDVVCALLLGDTATERLAGTLGIEEIARGMTAPAMPRPLDQVGTAIDLSRFRRIGLEAPVRIEQQIPVDDAPALIEREGDLVLRRSLRNRLLREQKSFDRQYVGNRHFREIIIGEGRVKVMSVTADAAVHRGKEIGVAPAADTYIRIGGDVGGVDRAERHLHG